MLPMKHAWLMAMAKSMTMLIKRMLNNCISIMWWWLNKGVHPLDREFSNNDKEKYRQLLCFQQYTIPVTAATHPAISSHHLPSRSAQHGFPGRSSLLARRPTDFSELDGQDTVPGTLWPLLIWLSLLLPGHWGRPGLPGRTGSGTPV